MTKKLSIGTEVISSFTLSASEICRIIRESARGEVSELRLGALELKFHAREQREEPIVLERQNVSSLADPSETYSEKVDSKNTEVAPLDPEAMKDFLETQRLLEDPASYEEELVDQAIEDLRRAGDREATRHRGSEQAL